MPPATFVTQRVQHHLRAIERLTGSCEVFVVAHQRDGELLMIFDGSPDEAVIRQALVKLAASDWNASKSL